MRRHSHIFGFYQVIGNAATAVKDVIEPMFNETSVAAAISHGDPGLVHNTKWMQKARKVHCRRNHNHVALPLPGRSQHTCTRMLRYITLFQNLRISPEKMLNQHHARVVYHSAVRVSV